MLFIVAWTSEIHFSDITLVTVGDDSRYSSNQFSPLMEGMKIEINSKRKINNSCDS